MGEVDEPRAPADVSQVDAEQLAVLEGVQRVDIGRAGGAQLLLELLHLLAGVHGRTVGEHREQVLVLEAQEVLPQVAAHAEGSRECLEDALVGQLRDRVSPFAEREHAAREGPELPQRLPGIRREREQLRELPDQDGHHPQFLEARRIVELGAVARGDPEPVVAGSVDRAHLGAPDRYLEHGQCVGELEQEATLVDAGDGQHGRIGVRGGVDLDGDRLHRSGGRLAARQGAPDALDDQRLRALGVAGSEQRERALQVRADRVPRVSRCRPAHHEPVEEQLGGLTGAAGRHRPGGRRARTPSRRGESSASRGRALGDRATHHEQVARLDVEAVRGERSGDERERAGHVGRHDGHRVRATREAQRLAGDVTGLPDLRDQRRVPSPFTGIDRRVRRTELGGDAVGVEGVRRGHRPAASEVDRARVAGGHVLWAS